MNTYPEFRSFFEDVSRKLLLLGREPGMVNLFFAEGPENASVLVSALRNKLTLPCLLVEFPDEDNENGESPAKVLNSSFVVLDQKNSRDKADNIEKIIYSRCRPAAEQIFAYMRQKTDRMELKLGGKTVSLVGTSHGTWVGPIDSNLYGWLINFEWRIAAGVCVNRDSWEESTP
ncbi:hypothetical protein LZD49_12435 [Dyadobacter sp. CY261]|uniref:hypothetical protein n=1 Tax=Dyadobacter sp. CY261 TaxID=2907203 RepID=UPI001F256463|nr:hypothetical protein [Dyadobacter sp. CY261]MCF0071280.1 hypothetical protein [Dyadobacter sp. CY261]